MSEHLLWPDYATPYDLAAIEAVPLEDRGLPETTYALLVRAAARWPAPDSGQRAARRRQLARTAAP